MKYIVLALSTFVLFSPDAAAQEQQDIMPLHPVMPLHHDPGFKYVVKVYNTSSYSRVSNLTMSPGGMIKSSSRKEEMSYLHPSVAFAWKTRRSNMKEIELSSFSMGKKTDLVSLYDSMGNNLGIVSGATVTSSNISVRFERIVNFDKNNKLMIRPMLGFGLNPYYTRDKVIPATSAAYPYTEQHFGVRAYIVPRINCDISKRLVLDVNIPVLVCALEANYTKQYVPGIAKELNSGVTDFNAFPRNFSARIGLGMRL